MINHCAGCGAETGVTWSDWSDRYLCEQCEEVERQGILTIDNPSPLWMPEVGNFGIILSKVNGWARGDEDTIEIFVDGTEKPYKISATDDYPSFLAAVKAYWS